MIAPTGPSWRDPKTDPPTKTGKILVWRSGDGPAIVNIEERWMAYWDGEKEQEPTEPSDWDLWCEINIPNDKLRKLCDTCIHFKNFKVNKGKLIDTYTCAAGHQMDFEKPKSGCDEEWGFYKNNCSSRIPIP